jgi:type IV secretory pathway ATPase VirB11/archaellum biosynthesis ATPase
VDGVCDDNAAGIVARKGESSGVMLMADWAHGDTAYRLRSPTNTRLLLNEVDGPAGYLFRRTNNGHCRIYRMHSDMIWNVYLRFRC